MDRAQLKSLILEVMEGMQKPSVRTIRLSDVSVTEEDRLDTGTCSDRVYTHDVLSVEQSPRLGAGIMEMDNTTFPWTLEYDEIDYILEGTLTIIDDGVSHSAGVGEIIFIPKGSKIQFSVPNHARFLYVTYPADWQNQA